MNQIFRLVHDEVLAAADKQQEPLTYGQLPAQQFYISSNRADDACPRSRASRFDASKSP